MAICGIRLATARSATHQQACPFLGRSVCCRSIPSARRKRSDTNRQPSARQEARCPVLKVTGRQMLVSIAFWEDIMSQQEVSSQPGVEVVYRSHVRVEAKPGGIKLLSLPAEPAPVPMGMLGFCNRLTLL